MFLRAALMIVVLAVASSAQAHDPPLLGGASFDFDLDLRGMLQGNASRITELSTGRLGGIETRGALSLMSVGTAVSAGFERVTDHPGGILYGGYIGLAPQWRPVALIDKHIFPYFDPYIELGGRVGGIGSGDDVFFRAALITGAGIDIGFAEDEFHPMLTIGYRLEPLRHPDDLDHVLLIGAGVRIAD